MSVESIDLVRDTTMQEISASLAAIANNTGGLTVTGWKNIQALVRSGLAKRMFSIGDQLVCAKETAITATVGHTGESSGITAASVNADTFMEKIGTVESTDYEFTYDGAEWHYNGSPAVLANYGITVTGTAVEGDVVIVRETAAQLVWDIIGIDHDTPTDSNLTHSLTLQLHDCYTSLQYDNTEALYYCEEELAAGTYNFTLLSGYNTTYGGGKTYQFTLANAVPAGGVIMFPWSWNTQAANTKISTYSSVTSTTAIESVSVTEGTDGTSLGTADGSTANMNHTHRIRYGSNNWLESAMRQYLNSSAAAGSVWSSKTNFDRPPTWATSTAGFLKDIDPEFLSVLGEVQKTTAQNTVTDGGGTVTSSEKIFLLSRSEVYAGNEVSGGDGTAYAYYSDYSDLSSAGTGADTNRIKYRNGSAQYWRLRTPHSGSACNVRGLTPTGTLNYYGARDTLGVAPACCII